MERGEEDTERDARKRGSGRRLGEDAGRGAGRRHPSRRLRKDARRAAGKEQQKRRVGEDRKKERNEGTHVNKLCRKQEVQAGRTKPEKQGHKRTERLRTGINRGKTGVKQG